MRMSLWPVAVALSLSACRAAPPAATSVRVANTAELREALRQVAPGTTVLLAPGEYEGGLPVAGLVGEPGRPIVLAAADPARRPWFVGGANGLQLSACAYVELRGLGFRGQTGNGLNVDDGGRRDFSAHHLTFTDLQIQDVGPDGNRDGLKLSGLRDFEVRGCTIERWGRGGSAIDMVGCHDGLIEGCTLRHEPGLTNNSGIQAKGGSRRVTIRGCRFEHAGSRAVNLGGSTGLEFFRPPLAPGGEHAEAAELTVEQCTFIGSQAPVAFVGVDGAIVRHCTIYRPARWVLRILQETREPGFVPCRGGIFEDNLIVFGAALATAVNLGPGTAPESFRFARNAWYNADAPARSRPELPTREEGGTYGTAPKFANEPAGDLRQTPDSPLRGRGAG